MLSFHFYHPSITHADYKTHEKPGAITIFAPDLETAIGRFHSLFPTIPIVEVEVHHTRSLI